MVRSKGGGGEWSEVREGEGMVTREGKGLILPPILLVLSNSDDQIIYFYVMSMAW